MKKYFINLTDKSLQRSLSLAIGNENISNEISDDNIIINDSNINSFIANLFNRCNGILVIGSYGKTSIAKMLQKTFLDSTMLPYFCNLGKDKEIFLNGDGFFILNPGMNLDLIKLLKPSIVVLSGITNSIQEISNQSEAYETAIKKASVGIIINDDCTETSIFKDINSNTLLYSMNKKGDILCKDYIPSQSGTTAQINKETYNLKTLGKDGIASAMAVLGSTDLLGFDRDTTKKSIESFTPHVNNMFTVATIAGVTIINDNSILPTQIEKNISFLKRNSKRLLTIFTADKNFYDNSYENSFSCLGSDDMLGICADDENSKQFESLAKKLRKDGIDASFYHSQRDTIKNIVTTANFGDILFLVGHKNSDFESFCNNIWIALESKVI